VNPETGKDCGLNEPGEIWARGPQVVMGYLNNKKATDEVFDQDAFLHTGDIGLINEEGFVTITDRLKELIKVKGIGVAPAELEDLLLGHPDVDDVAIIGIPDDYTGERPKAYVILNGRMPPIAERVGRELIKYVQDRKVREKWIKEVEIIHEIPRSPSGKILRRVLRDMQKSGKVGIVVREERVRTRL
jgi:4-coumarate--CoA ligase